MKLKFVVLPALALALTACEQKESKKAEIILNTDDDRVSYGLGMLIGERVLKQYGEVDYDLVLAGMKAQHQGETTLITADEAGDAVNGRMEKLFAERTAAARKRGEEYLASNKAKAGVKVTESGLQYEILTDAEGPKPKPTDNVTVHYRGTLIDGTEFDSSYSRNAPTSFQLNQVIPGWTEGLQLMSTGAKFRFVIPFDLGYGERGAGGEIGPFETLIFEVELLEVSS